MKIIDRPLYSKRIKPFIGKGIIKVLTGQRRVGKSYIMLQLMEEIKTEHPDANIIYINISNITTGITCIIFKIVAAIFNFLFNISISFFYFVSFTALK